MNTIQQTGFHDPLSRSLELFLGEPGCGRELEVGFGTDGMFHVALHDNCPPGDRPADVSRARLPLGADAGALATDLLSAMWVGIQEDGPPQSSRYPTVEPFQPVLPQPAPGETLGRVGESVHRAMIEAFQIHVRETGPRLSALLGPPTAARSVRLWLEPDGALGTAFVRLNRPGETALLIEAHVTDSIGVAGTVSELFRKLQQNEEAQGYEKPLFTVKKRQPDEPGPVDADPNIPTEESLE